MENSRVVGRIGLGMATLMREPSSLVRQEVLHAAYELGIRHFDVAPLYGLGSAEGELGSFIRRNRPDDLFVATKFGREASRLSRSLGPMQPVLRAAIRGSSGIRRSLRHLEGRVAPGPSPARLDSIRESVDRSIEVIGRDPIDLLLSHELEYSLEMNDFLFSDSTGSHGGLAPASPIRARYIGASGGLEMLSAYPTDLLGNQFVLQGPPEVSAVRPDMLHIYHSILSEYSMAVRGALVGAPGMAELWAGISGSHVLDARAIRAISVLSVLLNDSSARVVIGTTKSRNLRELLTDVGHLNDAVTHDGTARPVLQHVWDLAIRFRRPSAHGQRPNRA